MYFCIDKSVSFTAEKNNKMLKKMYDISWYILLFISILLGYAFIMYVS
jgi:hypothetical protein